jgi:pimeloyl-ACP methyl ester carboxylesterase
MATSSGPVQRSPGGRRDVESQDDEYTKGNKPTGLKNGVLVPRWLLILLATVTVASLLLGLMANIGLLIIAVDGKAIGEHVETVMSVVDTVQQQFPYITYYLQLFANATNSASSASVSEIFAGGSSSPAVPPVLYATLSTYGVRMAYRTMGVCTDGVVPVVVFIHDLTASSLEWLEEMTLVSGANLCAVAIDMLGHGNSDSAQLVSGGSVTSQVAYLHAFLTETGLISNYARELALAGSGFGGMVASSYLFTHDGAIDFLILQNPMPYAVYPGDDNATLANVTGAVSKAFLTAVAALELTNASALAQQVAASLSLNTVCTTSAFTAVTSAYAAVFLQAEPLSVVQGLVSMQTIDLRASFASVITPTLLIAGGGPPPEASRFNYALLAQATRNLIGASATLHIIGASSVSPLLTHSHLFHDYVIEFLLGDTSLCDSAPLQFSAVS